MFGGDAPRAWVAYVGLVSNRRTRLTQHFVRRDSSVVTGTTAVGLNVDHVRAVFWWQHPLFGDEGARHAAEFVAFDVLDPALRSRGSVTSAALALYEDAKFESAMEVLFRGPPTGRLLLPNHCGSFSSRELRRPPRLPPNVPSGAQSAARTRLTSHAGRVPPFGFAALLGLRREREAERHRAMRRRP